MTIEAFDEILSPQRCARCGGAFSPPPDKFVFCPACHACHIGLALPPGVVGQSLVIAWLKSFTGEDRVGSGSGYTMHQTDGRVFVVRHGEASRTSSGFATLFERGEADMVTGPRYQILRLAGFRPEGSPAGFGTSRQLVGGNLVLRSWGLELFVRAPTAIEVHDLRATFEEMARVAAASGYEPVFESSDADVAELPKEVSAALGARQERSIRCDACGAPVASRDLGASPRCPYCLAPIRVPKELARELEQYRRQLRAQDAQFSLRGADLWDGLRAADGAWLACAVCGSPRAHRPGVVDETCQHCGAMIVPSAQRLLADVGLARNELDALSRRRQAAAREQTEVYLRAGRFAMRLNVALFVGSTLMTAPFALLGVLVAVENRNVMGALVMLFMTGSLPFAMLLYVVYAVRRNARQRRQWGAIWVAIADQLDGVFTTKPNAWISRFWNGSLPAPRWMGPSAAKGAVEVTYDGVPLMIEADIEAKVGPFRQAYGSHADLRVFIAVVWPETVGVLKATRGVRERRRQLQAAGFSSCLRRGGLELKASHEVLQRLKNHPEQTVAVVPVLFEALRIVELLGGQGLAADAAR